MTSQKDRGASDAMLLRSFRLTRGQLEYLEKAAKRKGTNRSTELRSLIFRDALRKGELLK